MLDAISCLKKLGEVRSLSYATTDTSGMPRIRIIDTLLYEDKLYFVTARGKEFYRQITTNHRVGIVGLTKDWKMIRLSAVVKKAHRRFVDIVFELNPGMQGIYPGETRSILDAFCVERGNGEFFDLENTPIYRDAFSFGGDTAIQQGFTITRNCTACGICAQSCPQSCIEEGGFYAIRHENCLHCGMCAEICPVQAVIPLNVSP